MCGVILTLGYLDPMYRGCTVNDYDFIKLDTGEGGLFSWLALFILTGWARHGPLMPTRMGRLITFMRVI